MIQSWLLAHLIRTGHVTESGLSRRARIRPCPKCRTPILAGLDADTCALEVRADPVPLSPLGEALAQIAGLRTVALHREASHFVIDDRMRHDITARPAGTGDREDILREHRCGDRVAETLTSPTTFAETIPPLPAGSPAPF